MIVDSSFLIDLIRNVPTAVKASAEIESQIIKASSVSVFEVYKGIYSKKSQERVERLFDSMIIVPLDRKIAQHGGQLWLELQRKGEETDPEDCMIAATALSHNEPIITRNAKHFSRFSGLKIFSY